MESRGRREHSPPWQVPGGGGMAWGEILEGQVPGAYGRERKRRAQRCPAGGGTVICSVLGTVLVPCPRREAEGEKEHRALVVGHGK